MNRIIPLPYRILALVLLLVAGIGFGYVQGIARESDRRDALALKQERADAEAFRSAVESGKQHAANVITWQRRARDYYRNWQEELNNVPDSQLAECADTGAINRAPTLSASWVGLYNAAWLPGFDSGDTGGAAYALVEAGAVTPREALENVRINAELCGEDRNRLDELIDLLNSLSGSDK